MGGLDQPLLIANSNYHVGQQTSVRVAEEQGYFREEGLAEWVYEPRGLIPGPFEKEGLALQMEERGVDIATAVDLASILWQRAHGADLYIVGGWRYPPNFRLFTVRGITEPAQLRGKRIGIREAGGLDQYFIANNLRRVGIDALREVEWVFDRAFAYGNDPAHLDWLREGRVDALLSQPPYTDVLEGEGFPLLLDPRTIYPGGRPDKVIVATGRVIEQRPDDLAAFLRANIRGFWFMRDGANLGYLQDLERRLRAESHNDDERRIRMITSIEKVEGWTVPVHGGVAHAALAAAAEELVAGGEMDGPVDLADALRDGPVMAAYQAVSGRPELQAAHQAALAAAEKYGF
jgi:ABC-type nitrate/sulfonate/bicarbonate transport system substrate-binding protein